MHGRKSFGWRYAGLALWCAALTLQAGGVAAQTEPPADTESSSGWAVPPIRWGGTLTTDLRAQQWSDGERRLQMNDIANIRASSYLWQPWFALVSGGLGLLSTRERRNDDLSGELNETRKTNAMAVNGNVETTLFPVSRFPFYAYASTSDSRGSGEDTVSRSDFTTRRFGARQSYTPEAGGANYSASFDHSTLQSESFGRDTVNAFAASMNRNMETQSLDATANHARNTRSNTGEHTSLSQITGRHSYRPESDLTVESLVNANRNTFGLLANRVLAENRSNFLQANSFATWRPEEYSPLLVTGGLRLFRTEISGTGGDSESSALSANLGANYSFDRQTNVAASAVLTNLTSNGTTRMLSSQSASATYTADPRALGSFTYGFNANVNLANLTGLEEGNRFALGGRLEQSLRRDFSLREGSQLSFSVSQSGGVLEDTVFKTSTNLSHNANVSWRLSQGAATSAYVSANASDTRTTGYNANQFQLVYLQASGQAQYGAYASLGFNLTSQGVRQSTPATTGAQFTFNTSGNLSYLHTRALGVPRLRYTLLGSFNEAQFRQRLQGDFNAPRDQVTRSLEQRLDYNIGRVAVRLTARLARIDERRDALLSLRIVREFGGY